MFRPLGRVVALCVVFASFVPVARAAWPTDVSVNLPVCRASGDQYLPVLVPDGTGGIVAGWVDHRFGIQGDLFAQRIDGSGTAQWSTNGIAIVPAFEDQEELVAASDGAGGAIFAWNDHSNGGGSDIWATRITAAGEQPWGYPGIPVRMGRFANVMDPPCIVSDGAGGAIVAWRDGAIGGNTPGIMVQRVNASGTPQWGANGLVVCATGWNCDEPQLIGDGSSGAIVAWVDYRSGTGAHLYAQRIHASGAPLWGTNGAPVCTAAGGQFIPGIALSGDGGAIVSWSDERSDDGDLYVQRLDGSGNRLWATDGVAVCTASGTQGPAQLVPDGAGGADVFWADERSGVGIDFYAQRVTAAGSLAWGAEGVAVCTSAGVFWTNIDLRQLRTLAVSDGSGGLIAAWWDHRGSQHDLYAQRVDAGGAVRWVPEGVAVCTASGEQVMTTLVADGAGGAVVAWQDLRGAGWDIYAQRINAFGHAGDGQLAAPVPAAHGTWLGNAAPNPAHGATAIPFALAHAGRASIAVFDAQGRLVRTLEDGVRPAGESAVLWNGADAQGRRVNAGLYFVRMLAEGRMHDRRVVCLP